MLEWTKTSVWGSTRTVRWEGEDEGAGGRKRACGTFGGREPEKGKLIVNIEYIQ